MSAHGISTGVPDWLTMIVLAFAASIAVISLLVSPGNLEQPELRVIQKKWRDDVLHIRTVEALTLVAEIESVLA